MTKIFTDRNSSLKRQLLFLPRADLFASVLHGVLYSELVVCLALFCEPAVRGGDGSPSQLSLRHAGLRQYWPCQSQCLYHRSPLRFWVLIHKGLVCLKEFRAPSPVV